MTEAPRLEIKSEKEPGVACLALTGVIDERFDASKILQEVAPITILELSGIRRITSFGVRQWSEVMKAMPSTVRHLYLVRCPPVFVDQLSMVLNFGGRSEVLSVYGSYGCDNCGQETLSLLDFLSDHAQIASGHLTDVACPTCKRNIQLVDDPQLYVRLVNDFGAKSLDPAAASFLERHGLHALKKVGRPPEATKLVHDQITLFRLSGTLDGRFRQRRLASGVEGDVVFDLGAVDGLDAVGAERWRELLHELQGAVSITLVDVPDFLLTAIANGSFAVTGAGLYSYQAVFLCADCGNIETRPLLAMESLKGCVRNCPRCGRLAQPATDPALIARVFDQARPASVAGPVEDAIKNRHEILERARAESGALASQQQSSDSMARYRVIKPLTEGGMAEIFLAVHQGIAGFEKLVVLKKILRRMLERRQVAVTLFLNEAKIAANLNHANIVQTFEVGEHGGDLFIAMEYVHGIDVRRILRESILKNTQFPVEQVLYIGERVAAALHHAHTAKDLSGRSLNIVHRDVSPSNIMISFDGQVKLLDFGVASAAVGESFDGLIGKFSYMSPEQIGRDQTLDGRSDVFALGVVMHEMLARKPLFRRDKDPLTIRAVLEAEVPKLTNVPDYVDAVVRRALERRRDERYPDARAFQVAMEECMRRLGNIPSTEQMAQTISRLFPDQSAAPSFDPSMYRSMSAQTPSLSPASLRSMTGSADPHEATGTSSNVADATVVTNRSQVSEVSSAAMVAAAAAIPVVQQRYGTFPPAPNGPLAAMSELGKLAADDKTSHVGAVRAQSAAPRPADPGQAPTMAASPASLHGARSEAPSPTPPAGRVAPTPVAPQPTAVPNPNPTPTPGRPPTTPLGLNMLPPTTPPPPTPPPATLPLPLPAELQTNTPVPRSLIDTASRRSKRTPGDYWLIAAAVAAFIVGFLLVAL